MKIVYFIDHLRPDGTQRVLEQLAGALARRGHRQTIICLNDSWDGELIGRLRAAGVEVHVLGRLALLGGYDLLALWYVLKRRRYDVAVTLLFYSDVLGRALARAAGVPKIVSSIRARNANYAGWQRALARRTMRWADAVIVNSAAVRAFAGSEEGAPERKLITIPNGICVDDYARPLGRADLRAELRLAPERRLIGGVGRLTRQKGFDLLIDALARLPDDDVDLLLVGSGEAREALEAQARELGVHQRVHFAGYRRDVARLLGALDVYVQPSRFEGMPNALLEAMAAGCPIVASAVDGNRELVDGGVHGWLVRPDDAAALANTVAAALRDRSEARRRGAAAQERAAREFGVTAMVDAWEAVLAGKSI